MIDFFVLKNKVIPSRWHPIIGVTLYSIDRNLTYIAITIAAIIGVLPIKLLIFDKIKPDADISKSNDFDFVRVLDL